MDGVNTTMAAPLLISREDLHQLSENIINAANGPKYLPVIDAFLGTEECDLCHRRYDAEALKLGVCFNCDMRFRGALAIAKLTCKTCRGET